MNTSTSGVLGVYEKLCSFGGMKTGKMAGIRELKVDTTNICIFCNQKAQSRDHIPSKNLLEKPYPKNLLTFPSCIKCNHSFSKDEEYFLHVLVEISTNPTLLAKKDFNGNVFKARERSMGLKKLIGDSFIEGDDGKIYIMSNTNRINRVIEKNAMGLYYHKYKKLAKLSSFKCTGFYPFNVNEMRPAEIFLLTYKANFQPKKWTTIQNNVFSYIVVRDWRNNKLTMIFNIHNTAWFIIEIPYPSSPMPRYTDSSKFQMNLQFIP